MLSRASIALREQLVLDTLRNRPWSTTRMVSDVILNETGGRPALLTGAVYVPPWTTHKVLRRLEAEGRVERRQFSSRTILWAASQEREDATAPA